MYVKTKKIPDKILCLITDTKIKDREKTLKIIEEAVSNGTNIVQLREKHLPALDFLNFGRDIQSITRNKALFIINDRIDIAMILKCDGVHLGEKSIPINYAKDFLGNKFILGKSIHSVNETLSELESFLDYWIIGPIFKTLSHPNSDPIGLGAITELKKVSPLPIIGIGGITQNNSNYIIERGATGVAVKRYILESGNVAKNTKLIWNEINQRKY